MIPTQKGIQNEKDISTQQAQKKQAPWLQETHEDRGRTESPPEPQAERPEKTDCFGRKKALRMDRGAGSTILKKEILRGKKNFEILFRNGRKFRTGHLKFLSLENKTSLNRVAFVAGKKSGKSCFRNYSRRIFREIYRRMKDRLRTGLDIAVILIDPEFHKLDFTERTKEMSFGLERIAGQKRPA